MTTKQAIRILQKHNDWRRGKIEDFDAGVTTIGEAIDFAIQKLKELEVKPFNKKSYGKKKRQYQ